MQGSGGALLAAGLDGGNTIMCSNPSSIAQTPDFERRGMDFLIPLNFRDSYDTIILPNQLDNAK